MRIFLALPGPNPSEETKLCAKMASYEHEVTIVNVGQSVAFKNFNDLWCAALNHADRGEFDLFGMMHLDVFPQGGFLDIMVRQLLPRKLALISSHVPFKNDSGLCSCGVGTFACPWQAHRRLAIAELPKLPPTFTAADYGYPGHEYYLLHNHGLMLADLRFPWPDECCFSFPCKINRGPSGLRGTLLESEDWFFSRQVALAGLSSAITQTVRLKHGDTPNWKPGRMACDEELRPAWEGGAAQPLEIVNAVA